MLESRHNMKGFKKLRENYIVINYYSEKDECDFCFKSQSEIT